MKRRRPISDRFWENVSPEPNSGCWLWLGHADAYGYGQFWMSGKIHTAQRASWMLFRGPFLSSMQIDHICRTPSCVNPDHLRVITKSENLSSREMKKTKCSRGHPLVGENLFLERNGKVRRCKLCRYQWLGLNRPPITSRRLGVRKSEKE